MKGKIVRLLLLFSVFIFLTAGCAANIPEDNNEKVKDEITGSITMWADDANLDVINNAAKNFQEKHNGVKINIKNMSDVELYNRLNEGLEAGNEVPDIFTVDREMLHAYVEKWPLSFMDLTEEINSVKERFIKSQISEVTIDNKIMAIPWDTAPVVLFYRKDLLDDAGIKAEDIKTWNEYVEAGEKLLNQSAKKTKMLPLNENKNDDFYRILLSQLGTGYYSKDEKNMLSSPDSIKAMSLIKRMNDSEIAYDVDGIDAIIDLASEGSIATIPAEAAFTPVLMERLKNLSGKWQLMNLPAFEAGGRTAASLGSSAIMLTKKAEASKAVMEFAEYLTMDKDNIIYAVTHSGLYPAEAEYYSESWIDEKVGFFNFQDIRRIMAETAKDELGIYYPPDFTDIQRRVIEAQKKILSKGDSVEAVMSEMANDIDQKKQGMQTPSQDK